MAICAEELARKKKLKKNTVVATVMSNIGLELFLRERKIRMARGRVGDRYVGEAMRAGGYNFGGEQSGHMIFLDHATTGDGGFLGPRVRRWYREGMAPFEEAAPGARGARSRGGGQVPPAGRRALSDGGLARRRGGGSPRGAYIDSVVDRYAELL